MNKTTMLRLTLAVAALTLIVCSVLKTKWSKNMTMAKQK